MDDLLDCARFGELDDIKLFIDHNASSAAKRTELITAIGRAGNTMLHMAAANGHVHVAEYLISQMPEPVRAFVNSTNQEGSTALHWAALNGQLAIVELLIRNGADPKIKNSAGHTALYNAEVNEKQDVVQKLLELTNYDADEEDDEEANNGNGLDNEDGEMELPPNCSIRYEDDCSSDGEEKATSQETQPNR